ncbi:MAG: PIN domain protein [Phycisphaerae bacterium]|nr:PIN domain protein [Phycisphaerae bacterium]
MTRPTEPLRRRVRAFVDNSVFGGVFDDEFAEDSKRFFDQVASGRIIVLVSNVLLREILNAPPHIQGILASLPPEQLEEVAVTPEAVALTEAYLQAGILSAKWRDDAAQIALATLAKADVLLSWNFRHIVNYDRIRLFNSVNLAQGYGMLDIRCPKEIQDAHADEQDI